MTALFLSLSPSSQFTRSPLFLAREVAEPGPRGERPSPPHSSLPPSAPGAGQRGEEVRQARGGRGGLGDGGGRSSGFEASRLRPSASRDGRRLRPVLSPGRVLPEAAAERPGTRAAALLPLRGPSHSCAPGCHRPASGLVPRAPSLRPPGLSRRARRAGGRAGGGGSSSAVFTSVASARLGASSAPCSP